MTKEQEENRIERIAIMMFCGGQTREAADKYCDSKPWLYGIRKENIIQEDLIGNWG